VRNDDTSIRTEVLMGTFVTIQVVGFGTRGSEFGARDSGLGTRKPGSDGRDADQSQTIERDEAVSRAFEWFQRVEACCTRFDPRSELMQLTAQIGVAVPVSPILYEAVQFALAVAEDSNGAFDPTVGYLMERGGFNREHCTGEMIRTSLEPAGPVSYRDVRLDPDLKAITLLRPLILDLGAVAKGLAVDLAARELHALGDYAIDAGGDLYLAGHNAAGAPWSVGIRHPRDEHQLFDSLRVSNRAVCTSGDYERRSSSGDGHHVIDPRAGVSAAAVASVTVVAPTAMLADALATAAFVLGPTDGLRLFDRHGVDGLIVSPGLERYATRGMYSDYHLGKEAIAAGGGHSAVLPNAEGSPPPDPGDPGPACRAR
jgi:thiamine biosynthesis lipoprotein